MASPGAITTVSKPPVASYLFMCCYNCEKTIMIKSRDNLMLYAYLFVTTCRTCLKNAHGASSNADIEPLIREHRDAFRTLCFPNQYLRSKRVYNAALDILGDHLAVIVMLDTDRGGRNLGVKYLSILEVIATMEEEDVVVGVKVKDIEAGESRVMDSLPGGFL